MFGIRYFKADSSSYIVKTANGQVKAQGRGLSFFYNSATTSISSVPQSIQEASYIFTLRTVDHQSIRVQGQVTYQIADALRAATMLNFNLKADGTGYVSEDPLKLNDRVVRSIQSLLQENIEASTLRDALKMTKPLVVALRADLPQDPALSALGLVILDVSISGIVPTPETAKALEAEARESILKEADDAVYLRRKSAVEQERMIKEAELQTDLSVQEKEQEIEMSRLQNQRTLQRDRAETERERLQNSIQAETERAKLVTVTAENDKAEMDAEAYGISAKMNAFAELPVENLKAMALAQMTPEQLMAVALETLAQNAGKINELNIGPDMFSQLARKVAG
ncbi:SPFH domain-containing protein [Allohahella marinimesophila]|uniref:SPFH domain-containing protein n=1 Tax=Allohahella marinimesophila TaxID=1054972 RepID=A0ABP7PW79_9GAMM